MLYADLSVDNEHLYAGFTPLSEEVRRNNDMKELMACNTTRLQQMEFITLMRETVEQIEMRGATLIETDAPLKRYTMAIKAAIGPLEGATRDPLRRPETAVAHTKNSERRTAISRFGLRFKVYRLSEDADERQAYEALNILWRTHRLVYPLNVQKLTGATDNFLNDLTKSPYADAVQRLHLQTDVDAIRAANEAYRTHAAQRRANEAQRTPVDVGVMRRAITEDYTRLSLYLAVMADAYPEVEAWSRTLSGLNVLRKHYAELLARRAGARRAKKNAAALTEAAAESTAPSTFATNP